VNYQEYKIEDNLFEPNYFKHFKDELDCWCISNIEQDDFENPDELPDSGAQRSSAFFDHEHRYYDTE
jgi:hypothetical protein